MLIIILSITLIIVNNKRHRLIEINNQLEQKYNDSTKLKDKIIFDLNKRLDKITKAYNDIEDRLYDPVLMSQKYAESKLSLLKRESYTGPFKMNYLDGSPQVTGYLINGYERGTWTYYYPDGTQEKYLWVIVRIGAECCDGTTSSATGRGACSWHGGVCRWIYDYEKYNIN